jgi:hypothetical protein
MRKIVVLAFSTLLAITGSTILLVLGFIGQMAYCFLLALTALLVLVVSGFGRLKELDIRQMRLVLHEMKETQKDIFVREERLKAIAIPLAQMLAYSGVSQGRFSSKKGWVATRQWYRRKLEDFSSALDASPSERAEISKYLARYTEIDSILSDGSLTTNDPDYQAKKIRVDQLSAEIESMLIADASSPSLGRID